VDLNALFDWGSANRTNQAISSTVLIQSDQDYTLIASLDVTCFSDRIGVCRSISEASAINFSYCSSAPVNGTEVASVQQEFAQRRRSGLHFFITEE
jgi:hypothetical protein